MNVDLRKILPLSLFLFILAFIVSNDIHAEIIKLDKRRLLSPLESLTNVILSKILRTIFYFPLSGATVKTYTCFAAYGLADVMLGVVRRFPEWFNDDTVMELYAAGEYKGLDGITEYVNFVYSDDFAYTNATSSQFLFTDEITADSDSCNITYVQDTIYNMSNDLYPENTCYETPVAFSSRFKINGEETFVTFEKINLFYSLPHLINMFESSRDGAYAERICGIMEENCEDVWAENGFTDQTECQATVNSMPKSDEGYADGRTQACRWVHSVFAAENKKHCAHISSIPLEDNDGSIKCQEPQSKVPSDIFSEAELDFIYDISMNELGYNESLTKVCGD